jgi:hypothetical protein
MPNRTVQKTQLTDDEIVKLRELLEHDRRVRWFWSTARTWAVGLAAIVGGVTIGWETIVKIIRAAGKG